MISLKNRDITCMKYEIYLEMPREPSLKDKNIWKDYFKKFQQRFIHNERVFMLYRTASFEQKSIKKVNNEHKYLLENELIILSKAEEQYFRLFKEPYKISQQIKNEKFQYWLPYLTRLDFVNMGAYMGNDVSLILMDNRYVVIEGRYDKGYKIVKTLSKQKLIKSLINLDIGYWSEDYYSFEAIVEDGSSWILKFKCIKNKKYKEFVFYGDNCYPYNFDDFAQITYIKDFVY